MTRRERAIEAAAKASFLHDAIRRGGATEIGLKLAGETWDSPENRPWVDLKCEAMTAAISEYERVMGEGEVS